MHPKQFALLGGAVMILMSLLAFVPALSVSPADAALPILRVETSYGQFLNFFPMNVFNKAALLAFGIAGIYCATRPTRNLPASVSWSRWVFVVMGLAAVFGLFPATSTLFGYWPLFGGEVLAHGVFALLGAYFGFALPARAENELERRFPDTTRKAG